MSEEELEGWVTTEQAEEISGVSRSTLYIYRFRGKVETRKIGSTVLYRRSDLEQIAEEQRKKKGPSA